MKRILIILFLPILLLADIQRINEDATLPYWPDYILSGDPNELDQYFRILLKSLQDIQDEIITTVNLGVDLDDTDVRYFGTKDQNGNYADGDWRIIKIAADDFEIQKLISSTWTQMSKWAETGGFEYLTTISDSASSFDITSGTITGAVAITASGAITGGTLTDGTFTTTAGVTSTGSLALTTDLAVQYGGTGASTLTDGGPLLGSGTNAITAMAVLADSEMIVGDGITDPVAESGATLRTSIGVGTGDSPTFTGLTLSGITDTHVLYSNATVLAGDSTFTFNDSTKVLTTTGQIIDGTIAIGLDMSSGTFATAAISLPALSPIQQDGEHLISNDLTLFNIYIGKNAGTVLRAGGQVGNYNILIGEDSGMLLTSGFQNVLIGANTGAALTTQHNNFCLGLNSGFFNIGVDNFFLGTATGFWKAGGDANIAIGTGAGTGVSGNAYSRDIFIGYQSGFSTTTGSDDIYIGYKSGYNQTTNSNLLIIDNQDRGSIAAEITDTLMYGVFNATPASQSLRLNVGNFYLGNPTHSDADGGGLITQTFIREDGAGTATSAASIAVSHDGAVANDQLGKIVASVNTGAGLVEATRIDSSANFGVGATDMDSLFEVDGPQGLAIETVTGNTTLDNTHSTLLVNASGNVTVTLPTSASSFNNTDGIGRIYRVKKIDADADTVTLDGDGSETIDGATTAVITTQYETVTLQADGSNWYII